MHSFSELTPQYLNEKLDINDFILIDVREVYEYQIGYIKGSINIPLAFLPREIENHVIDKPIIMICRSGIRSKIACEMLIYEGCEYQLYNLTGGIISWQKNYNIQTDI